VALLSYGMREASCDGAVGRQRRVFQCRALTGGTAARQSFGRFQRAAGSFGKSVTVVFQTEKVVYSGRVDLIIAADGGGEPGLTKCPSLGPMLPSRKSRRTIREASSSQLHSSSFLTIRSSLKPANKLPSRRHACPQEPRPLSAAVRRPLLHQSHPPAALAVPTSSAVVVDSHAPTHSLFPHLGRAETRVGWYDAAGQWMETRADPAQSRRSLSQSCRTKSPWRTT
jgi:hypothetical protein